MSMSVKVTTPPVTVEMRAAIRAAMVEAAAPILAHAAAEAPFDPNSRHAVHMDETGFTRYAQPAPDIEGVAVGFSAFYAPWQEINDQYHHEHGHAHFLETAMVAGSKEWLAAVGEAIRTALGA